MGGVVNENVGKEGFLKDNTRVGNQKKTQHTGLAKPTPQDKLMG